MKEDDKSDFEEILSLDQKKQDVGREKCLDSHKATKVMPFQAMTFNGLRTSKKEKENPDRHFSFNCRNLLAVNSKLHSSKECQKGRISPPKIGFDGSIKSASNTSTGSEQSQFVHCPLCRLL